MYYVVVLILASAVDPFCLPDCLPDTSSPAVNESVITQEAVVVKAPEVPGTSPGADTGIRASCDDGTCRLRAAPHESKDDCEDCSPRSRPFRRFSFLRSRR